MDLGGIGLGWRPNLVHAHDWHTGPLMALLRFSDTERPKTVYTIHNPAFEGNFPLDTFGSVGLPPKPCLPMASSSWGRSHFSRRVSATAID